MAACKVSFLDYAGIRHSVETEATSMYEAAVLAIRTFREHGCEPGTGAHLEVQVVSSVTHTVQVQKVRDWLDGGARSPQEMITKERLKALI
jgi:hypothetical protein